jgi:EAL domain-containing protein (putative c-di-GMP-specific phosphodiesterase class I)/GGDEF domain-containing protein
VPAKVAVDFGRDLRLGFGPAGAGSIARPETDSLRAMSSDLLNALPDLLLLVKRDGSIVRHQGGQGVPELRPVAPLKGTQPEVRWSETTTTLIRQLARKVISQRTTLEAQFREQGRQYEIRVTAQGPDRALCAIRNVLAASRDDSAEATGERPRPELDRRGFLKRFKESLSVATLREKSIAVAVLYIDEIPDIAQVIAAKVSEQVMSAAFLRLSARAGLESGAERAGWYIGQLGENLLAVVVESSDRQTIDACVAGICASLREPISIGDAEFRLTPYAGVGILGVDATTPRVLLEHARAAAAEARRAASNRVFFFSDTLKMQSLARIDIARELRDAIADGNIRLRYTGRHDLATGERVTLVGYVSWLHPARGEIRPSEFLRVAQSTGLATSLSRSILARLREDFAALAKQGDARTRISVGALRDHILHEDFVAEVGRFLDEGSIPATRLELRIAERTLVARDPVDFLPLHRRGVQFVVDEAGRGVSSLSRLARAPLAGLQLDRAWVNALSSDPLARKVCHAGISLANALGLTAIATGVDDEALRATLINMGCRFGIGDLYGDGESNISELARAATSA